MSLSTREQRILDSIKDGLVGSDPELASLLVTFDRLASGEAMPRREKVRPGRRPRPRRLRHRLTLSQAALLVWLMVTALLIGIALILTHTDGPDTCAAPLAAVCPAPTQAHSQSPVHPVG
jgi:Protein of unknown function (DUF3040)